MKKALLTLVTLCAAMAVQAQANIWENPSVIGVNKEQPRTQLQSYSSVDAAFARAAGNSTYVQVLDAEWTSQPVPNATAYRAKYKVPFAWIDRELFLRIPAMGGSYEVNVNGEQAGYSQDAKTPAEFDITKRSKEGYNELEILVYNTPASRVLENYTQPITAAAPAGVCILAQPKVRIRDIVVNASWLNDGGYLEFGAVVKSHLLNEKRVRVYYELLTPDGKTLSTAYRDAQFQMRGEDTVRFSSRVSSAQPWSAERPVLYTLMLKLQQEGRFTEYISAKVGFRSVGIEGESLTINGQPLAAVVADFTPSGDVKADQAKIAGLKQTGVNMLRLLPYPQSEAFYDMCDRVGIYLCDQADVDTHLAGASRATGGNPSNDPRWRDAFVDRALGMYHNSKIHPSVVMFSTANNSSNGYNLYESYLALKAVEPYRPVVYPAAGGEWDSDAASLGNGTLVMRTPDYKPAAPLLADATPVESAPQNAYTAPAQPATQPAAPVTQPQPAAPATPAAQPAQPVTQPAAQPAAQTAPSAKPAAQPSAPATPAAKPATVTAAPAAAASAARTAETEKPVIPLAVNVDDARLGYFSLTNLYASTPLTRVEIIYSVVSGRKEMSHGSLLVDVDAKQTTPFKVPLGDYIIGGKFEIFLEIAAVKDQLVNFIPQQYIDQTKKDKRRKPVDKLERVTVDALEFAISL